MIGVRPSSKRLVTELKQHFRDRNSHRADFFARATKRRRLGQVTVSFDPFEAGREDGTERSAINVSIAMPPDLPVDRADVEARATANALEDIAIIARHDLATAIVEEDNVDFGRSVGLVVFSRSGYEMSVSGDSLTGSGSGEERQEVREVLFGGE